MSLAVIECISKKVTLDKKEKNRMNFAAFSGITGILSTRLLNFSLMCLYLCDS